MNKLDFEIVIVVNEKLSKEPLCYTIAHLALYLGEQIQRLKPGIKKGAEIHPLFPYLHSVLKASPDVLLKIRLEAIKENLFVTDLVKQSTASKGDQEFEQNLASGKSKLRGIGLAGPILKVDKLISNLTPLK